jgi:hypothetical protein
LVFIKKNNQIDFLKKPKPVQTDRFRFGFLGQNPVQTCSARFFRFGSVWVGLARFFSGLGSVWFFRFQAYKTKTEPVGFFKILISLIGFFYYLIFSVIFFLVFLI